MNRITAIKTFFEQNDGTEFNRIFPPRPVKMDELKNLPAKDREELGILAAAALGVELTAQ